MGTRMENGERCEVMSLKEMVSLFFVALFFIGICRSHGVEGRTKAISVEEDLEFERQLKVLNKPALKTIKTEYGDIYDCIDINKQPALDHPLLQNHTIQTRPSFRRKGTVGKVTVGKAPSVGFKRIGCPRGTVPIRRTKKEDLIRAKSLSKVLRKRAANIQPKGHYDRKNYRYAYIEVSMPDERFYGAHAYINVWNPQVVADQFSNSQIWFQNGLGDQLNMIEAGWTVNCFLFGDNRTRAFTYWTSDGYQKTGCYNSLCPGFVQVSEDTTPDMVLDPVSKINGNQVELKIKIEKDHDEYDGTNGYWLTLNGIDVGFWPNYLFSSLHNGAYEVHFGGQVFNPANEVSPEMSSGIYPGDGYQRSGYIGNVQVLIHTFVDPDRFVVKTYEDSSCYRVGDGRGQSHVLAGYGFYFGGPGGQRC